MPRPVKKRRICELPKVTEFSPVGIYSADKIIMTVDEFEVIRLIDKLKLSQDECATQMNVARTTVQLIYDSARSKIAETIIDGKTLQIEGGSYEICTKASICCRKSCQGRKCSQACSHSDSCPKCFSDSY